MSETIRNMRKGRLSDEPEPPEDPPPGPVARKKMVNDLKSSKLVRKVMATNASKKLKKIG